MTHAACWPIAVICCAHAQSKATRSTLHLQRLSGHRALVPVRTSSVPVKMRPNADFSCAPPHALYRVAGRTTPMFSYFGGGSTPSDTIGGEVGAGK